MRCPSYVRLSSDSDQIGDALTRRKVHSGQSRDYLESKSTNAPKSGHGTLPPLRHLRALRSRRTVVAPSRFKHGSFKGLYGHLDQCHLLDSGEVAEWPLDRPLSNPNKGAR